MSVASADRLTHLEERRGEGVELKLRFEDRPVRHVSLRQLCRRGSALLDELAREGCAVLISRWGRPVAVLAPLDDDSMVPVPRRGSVAEEPEEIPALEGDQREILESVVASYPGGWLPHSGDGLAIIETLTRLEMKKLVQR